VIRVQIKTDHERKDEERSGTQRIACISEEEEEATLLYCTTIYNTKYMAFSGIIVEKAGKTSFFMHLHNWVKCC
jgi:hypothetical protein